MLLVVFILISNYDDTDSLLTMTISIPPANARSLYTLNLPHYY